MKMVFRDYANNQEITATIDTSDMPVPRVGEDLKFSSERNDIWANVMRVTYVFDNYPDNKDDEIRHIEIDYIPYL